MSLVDLSVGLTLDAGKFVVAVVQSEVAARNLAQSVEASAAQASKAQQNAINDSTEAARAVLAQADSYDAARASIERYQTAQAAARDAAGENARAAVDSAISRVGEAFTYIQEKVKTAAIILAVGLVSAGAAAAYGAYRLIKGTLSTIGDLISGDFYKSPNIDALIAYNKQLLALQDNLRISAQEAGALVNATARLGVNPETYSSVRKAAQTAPRTNADEFDRLGVVYKDASGELLKQDALLKNVKKSLDEYTAGWDRDSAAVALGIGSYAAITEALKVTSAELEKSKTRLDDYNLGVGKETQAAVASYQAAMREFDSETQLMEQGFKRVFADALMPLFTDLATYFREGFPSVVNGVRVGVASIIGLFYAMKDGVYIVTESILASVESLGLGLAGIGKAAVLLAFGDVSGAAGQVAKGFDDARGRIKQAGSNIVDQVLKNNQAIRLAFAADDRDKSLAAAARDVDPGGAKKFIPKPATAGAGAGADTDALLKRLLQGELQAIKAQGDEKKSIIDFQQRYEAEERATGLISLASYFADEKVLRDKAVAAQVQALDKEIAAQRKYEAAFSKDENRQGARNEIAKLQDERATVVRKAAEEQQIALLKEAETVRQVQQQYQDLIATVSEFSGTAAGRAKASTIKVDRQVFDAGRSVAAAGGDPALVNQYKDQLNGQFKLSEAQRDYNRLLETSRNAEELIAISATASSATEVQVMAAVGAQREAALRQMSAMVDKANALAAVLGTDEAIQFADRLALAFKRAAVEVDPFLTKMRELGKQAGESIANNFEAAITQGKSLRDVLKGIGADLLQIVTRQAVTKPLGDWLTQSINGSGSSGGGLFGGLLSGLFGGGGFNMYGGAAGVQNSNLMSLFGNGGAFANGGSPPVGRASLVGERGPELFIPRVAGTIIPNNALGNNTHNTVNVTVNQSFAQGTSRATVMQAASNARRELEHAGRNL